MANIKVELSHEIIDGQPVTFVAPCDCTAITGLKVYYPGGSKVFTFKDAHGNVLTGIGNLFGEGAYVKAILDVTNGNAYLQNADTNAYLEECIIKTYTHSVNGLTGSGTNGRFKATMSGTFSSINVNGETFSVKRGDESSIDLVAGCWYTFILDGNTINFNAGGTGAGLNFKVVGGTTEPVSPSENTIWVNTDTAISDWLFAAVEPETPVEGMIWFTVVLESPVSFNALKKNGIVLYPVSASQYVDGAWADKLVKSYHGVAWVDWWIPGTLYENGRDDTAITGGWKGYNYVVDSGYTGTNSITVTMEDDHLVMKMSPSSSYRSAFASTVNTVDLTGYKNLHFDFLAASGPGWAVVQIFNASGTSVASGPYVWKTGEGLTESVDMDISKVSGACRVGVMMWTNTANSTITVKVSRVRLS